MKATILFSSLLLCSTFAIAQDISVLPQDASTGKVGYADVITLSGQTKGKLFTKAKKWIITRNTEANPYSITIDSEPEGSINGKGSFALSADRRKYLVQFAIALNIKDNKYKYEFTDFKILFTSPAGSSGGGYGGWGGSSYREAEKLEYTLETFYPIRLEKRKKPVIRWYEEINKKSFETIDAEMRLIESSLRNIMSASTDW